MNGNLCVLKLQTTFNTVPAYKIVGRTNWILLRSTIKSQLKFPLNLKSLAQ